MYTRTNFKTKKAMVDAFIAGDEIEVYQPGPFGPQVKDGEGVIEGPHFPEAHKWYAKVEVKDGIITKIFRS